MYRLEWRRVTAGKGTPRETKLLVHVKEDELLAEIQKVLPTAMWVYIEDEQRMPT